MCFQDAGWDGGPWHSEYEPTLYTTWTNYFEMIKGKVGREDWHFTQEDIKPGLVWGAQVVQEIARQVRVSENLLVTAEKMAAMDYLFNGKSWPVEDFAEAWRTLMLAQHHDCWIVPYNGRPGNTWADKVVRWTDATNQIASEKILNLFDRTDKLEYIRVYNTLGLARKEEVVLILPEHLRDRQVKVVDAKGNLKLLFEASVPGMGYATYRLKLSDKELPSEKEINFSLKKLTIETDYYSVIIDPAHGGTITSLIDKKNRNRQLVQNGKYLNDLRGFFYREGRFHQGSESRLGNTLYSSWDSIKHNVILNWVDITGHERDYGVALFSDHTTSYLQSDSLPLGLTVQYSGKALWGRDYRIHGSTEMRYALLPHYGDWENGEVEKASSQWNEPMVAQFTTRSTEIPEMSLLETVGDNLGITSMIVEDGNLLVRIYNTSSRKISREVVWNCSVDKIEQVDLKGDPIRELSPVNKSDGRFLTTISIPQFGFATLRLIDFKIKE
jgi:hypothetical protein